MKRLGLFNKIGMVIALLSLSLLVGCNSEKKQSSQTTIVQEKTLTNELKIHVLDTGNSDCILLQNGSKGVLIDAGDNDDEKFIPKYLKEQGIEELEMVFATHPHADHIGGLDAVVENFKIDKLYVSNGDNDTKTYRDFINSAMENKLQPSVPLIGSKFEFGNAIIEVISVANLNDHNNNSLVLLVKNGEDSLLFMGDAEKEIEKNLNIRDVDFLKVGHHGSHSSSTSKFIEKTNPEFAIITVGEGNSYGHPHSETMETFSTQGIDVYRTDESGTMVFTSTGNGVVTDQEPDSYNSPNRNK